MTVSAQNSYISYTGNGSTSAYSWPYKLFAAGDLKVYTVVIATGVETLQTSGGAGTYDYTISVNADYSGATVTLNNNLPTTHKVFLTRVQALEQATDYIEGDAFPAETHEQTLDKIVLQLQQHEEQLKRSLKFKQSTATRSEPPIPELTADTLIKVNSAGTGFETQSTVDVSTVAGIASDITTVSGIASDVTAVAADATDIGTVATNIASVNTVATNINDVIKVADDLNEAISEVETVANDLNEATSEIEVVANNIADVNTVGNATNIANISTVAGQISPTNNISTVAGIAPDITTLAGTSGLTTLAANAANISIVAGINADVTAVAAIDSAVSAVNSNAANINAVNANSANINAVNANSTNINTVATDLAGSDTIGTVATNIGQVQNFAQAYRISATAPTTSLDIGDLWFDTTNNVMKVYSSGGWITAASAINGTADRFTYTVSSSTSTITGPDDDGNTLAYDAGYLDVYLNGVKMVNGTDVTVTSGTSIVFASAIGASGTDVVDIVAFGTFQLANFSINDANDVSTSGVTDGQVLVYNSSSSTFQPGNASSAEVYGFSVNASGELIVTTTNEGADNIDAATYATFDDVLFAASGFTFSIDSGGNLIATV